MVLVCFDIVVFFVYRVGIVLVSLWYGLVLFWYGVGVVLIWFVMVLVWFRRMFWYGLGMVLVWFCYGFRMVLVLF